MTSWMLWLGVCWSHQCWQASYIRLTGKQWMTTDLSLWRWMKNSQSSIRHRVLSLSVDNNDKWTAALMWMGHAFNRKYHCNMLLLGRLTLPPWVSPMHLNVHVYNRWWHVSNPLSKHAIYTCNIHTHVHIWTLAHVYTLLFSRLWHAVNVGDPVCHFLPVAWLESCIRYDAPLPQFPLIHQSSELPFQLK